MRFRKSRGGGFDSFRSDYEIQRNVFAFQQMNSVVAGPIKKREEQTPLAGVMPLSERPENRTLISLQQWIKLTPAFDESKAGGL